MTKRESLHIDFHVDGRSAWVTITERGIVAMGGPGIAKPPDTEEDKSNDG